MSATEKRDNSEVLGRRRTFLSTNRSGSHTLVFGYDRYNDMREAENHQSGSDYRIPGTSTIIQGETIYPVFLNNNSTFIQHDPITLASTGSDIRTHALFVNDSWRLNEGISINLGLRWDKNQGDDAAGNLVSNSSKLSHRLGIVWDPTQEGNGRSARAPGVMSARSTTPSLKPLSRLRVDLFVVLSGTFDQCERKRTLGDA